MNFGTGETATRCHMIYISTYNLNTYDLASITACVHIREYPVAEKVS